MAIAEHARLDQEGWVEDLPKIMEVVSDLATVVYAKVSYKEVLGDTEPHPPFVERMGQVMPTTDDVHADIERLMDAVRALSADHQSNVLMYLGGYSQESLSILASGDVEESVAALAAILKPEVIEVAEVVEVIEPVEVIVVVEAEVPAPAHEVVTPKQPREKVKRIAKPAVKQVVEPVIGDEPDAPPLQSPQTSRIPTVRLPLPKFRDEYQDPEEDWRNDALCAQTDPEAFFPEKGGSTRSAKHICTMCEARSECLHYAMANGERFGIWGGLSERERRKLSPLKDDANAAKHNRQIVSPDEAILKLMPAERFSAISKSGSHLTDGTLERVYPNRTLSGRVQQFSALVGNEALLVERYTNNPDDMAATVKALLHEFYPPAKSKDGLVFMRARRERLTAYFSHEADIQVDRVAEDLTELSHYVRKYRQQFELARPDDSFAEHYLQKGSAERRSNVTNIKPRRTAKAKSQLAERSA